MCTLQECSGKDVPRLLERLPSGRARRTAKYLGWKSMGTERRHAFMRAVEAWSTKHNANPNKARLRMHTELDGVLQICAVQSSGLRHKTKYDVELAAWKKEDPGQVPPRIAEMDIETPNGEVLLPEGVMVRATTEGHHSVIRYSDFGQQSSKVVYDGECVITEDQQYVKRMSCLHATGIASLEKAVSAVELLQLANAISVAGSESNEGQDPDDNSIVDQEDDDFFRQRATASPAKLCPSICGRNPTGKTSLCNPSSKHGSSVSSRVTPLSNSRGNRAHCKCASATENKALHKNRPL